MERDNIAEAVEKLVVKLEQVKIKEYVEMLENPGRLIFLNFLLGIGRGIGAAIGFSVVSVVLIYLLKHLLVLNLPVISDFIAKIIQLVNLRLGY
ncbi:DUF5665 domain-containing protein [Carboxydothermus ferrireducens]|uniref:Uncharacterized protein n=1 Tax=Carboxydothermus ferrireducens DSM 11255 TaxID=1119529 RepID=A0ABX2RAS3_9THEO|nr:DUF5665 domain-containing protein [Carboxydothermus ferrireducens]NYE58279.1 hypothetical protein [Carboxydothermus ferrireducens DSM 11255]